MNKTINNGAENTAGSPSDVKIPWGAVMVLVVGTFMAILDTSIVNVAIPNMKAAFGATTDNIQWVLTAYMLVSGVVIPLTGFLCLRYGHKRLYIISLLIFTVGSAFCGIAWNTGSIIIARVIQALGGGMIMPISMAMIYAMVPKEKLGTATGVWGVAAAMGPAIGPSLGGYLVEYYSWPLIFTINVPVGIITVLYAMKLLEETPQQKDLKMDILGAFLIGISCFALLLAVHEGQDRGWTSQYIVNLFLISAFTLIFFIQRESSIPYPLLDLRLFKSPVMVFSLLNSAIITILLFAVVFLIPIYAQNLLGYSPLDTGLMMFPMALATGFLMPVSGKLFDKFGAFGVGMAGLIIVTAFTYYFRTLSLDTGFDQLRIMLALRAVGFGLAMMPILNAGMNSVPGHLVSTASAAMNLIRQVAGAVGIAYTTYFLNKRQVFHEAVLSETFSYSRPTAMLKFTEIQDYLSAQGLSKDLSSPGAASLLKSVVLKQSYMRGIDDVFMMLTILGISGILLMFTLTNRRIKAQRKRMDQCSSPQTEGKNHTHTHMIEVG